MIYSKEEKAMWLEDWKESGKSAWAYAKANGLNLQTFTKWTKQTKAAEPYFIEVTAKTSCSHSEIQQMPKPEILIEKGDVKIHVPLAINHNELRAIMEGLGGTI